ncbi:MAG: hypothetical protein GC155_11845 [Alphaproteobacteria bacterium]|nr:hypothetical protein [Alphaproteobacteria bacterium]
MKRLLRRFLKDRTGAFAMQFALMVVPLMACTGLAIDGGRAFLARFELGSALDAAALAVGSTSTTDTDQLNAVARKFVDTNFHQAPPGSVQLDLDPSADVVTLKGTVQVDTFFMPIMGIGHIDVSAESEVRRGGSNIEVALVLDTTGSMAGQRMTDLKAAAKDLVDIVVSDKQTPWYSKLSLISYGDNVNLGDYADSVRGAAVDGTNISDATWKKSASRNISGATWKNGSQKSISNVTRASAAVVTSNSHGLSNGDYIYIAGVHGMTQLNNKEYLVSDVTSNTFKLKSPSSGNYINSSYYSSYSYNGTIQKCFDKDCEVQVTSSGHGFSNGDFVHIDSVHGMTDINNNYNQSWTVTNVASDTFILSGSNGPNYSDYSYSGTATECFTASCEVRVTSASHGLSNNDYVYITGVSGMTDINTSGNNSWQISDVTGSTFILDGSQGPRYSNYSNSGKAWCLKEGCEYYRFTNASGSTRVKQISDCVSERTGAHAYDDVGPDTALVSPVYPGGGSYGGCRSYAALKPLTANKDTLETAITDLDTNDSTAGHIGLAWGWYMISPNWGYLWPDDTNRPHPYGEQHLAKVLVLMTDGDFNTAYCDGVIAKNYGVDSSSYRINCNATNGSPFDQAASLCTSIKNAGITIYTVGFGGDLSNGGGAFLKACATDDSHAYLAVTGDDLKAAFKSIAKSISLLRLSK